MTSPIFKIRCSAIGQIMSDPQWKTPMQKYQDCLEKIKKWEEKYDLTVNKETKTAQKLRDDIQRRKDDLGELEKNKDDIVLSKTCMTYIDQWIKENYYGRRKFLKTRALQKWVECEQEAIFVLNKALGTNYAKSIYKDGEKMENEWMTWHEDIDDKDNKTTIDTKVCETIDTFPIIKEEVSNDYRRQGQGYMCLKGADYKRHWVAKVLVNSPAWMIKSKLRQIYNEISKKYEDMPDIIDQEYESEARQYFLANVFDQQLVVESNGQVLQLTEKEVIPYDKRANIQFFGRDDDAIESIKARVMQCRQYLHNHWYTQF